MMTILAWIIGIYFGIGAIFGAYTYIANGKSLDGVPTSIIAWPLFVLMGLFWKP